MKSIEYREEDIFRQLKNYDWNNFETQVAWITDKKFDKSIIERVNINEWALHNDYYYFVDKITAYHVYNLINYYYIFKGVLFTRDAYNDPNYETVEKYCEAKNLHIVLLTGVKIDDI